MGCQTLLQQSRRLLQQGLNLRGCLDVAVHQVPAIVVRHAVQQVPDGDSSAPGEMRHLL